MQNERLNLCLIQSDLIWEDPVKNLKKLGTLLNQNSELIDLILLPEMFTTGFSMNPKGLALNEQSGCLESLIEIAKKTKAFVAGSVIWKENEHYKNRFLLVNENGIQAYYDKRNLFTLGGETKAYQPGSKKENWQIKGWKISPFICYDLRFPEWCNNTSESDLFLFTANWPQSRQHHWKSLLTARAIENQCFVAGVNRVGEDGNKIKYSGGSLVIHSNGTLLKELGDQEEIVHISLHKNEILEDRKKYPFLKDRNSR